MIPTGIAALDEALGGGMPQGVVHVWGQHPSLGKLREVLHQQPHVIFLGNGPPLAGQIPEVVAAHIFAMGDVDTLIFDLGDITDSFVGQPPHVVAETIAAVRDVAIRSIRMVSVFFELQGTSMQCNLIETLSDAALGVGGDGRWYVTKQPVHGGFKRDSWFFPLSERKRPLTPERVAAALLKDPELAWKVLQLVKVLGPWELETGTEMSRHEPGGRVGALISHASGDPPDVKSVYYRVGVQSMKWVNLPTLTREWKVWQEEADEILRANGFILLDKVPGDEQDDPPA